MRCKRLPALRPSAAKRVPTQNLLKAIQLIFLLQLFPGGGSHDLLQTFVQLAQKLRVFLAHGVTELLIGHPEPTNGLHGFLRSASLAGASSMAAATIRPFNTSSTASGAES